MITFSAFSSCVCRAVHEEEDFFEKKLPLSACVRFGVAARKSALYTSSSHAPRITTIFLGGMVVASTVMIVAMFLFHPQRTRRNPFFFSNNVYFIPYYKEIRSFIL